MKLTTRLWRRKTARPTPEQVGTARRVREMMDRNSGNFLEFRMLMRSFRAGYRPERAYTKTGGRLTWFNVSLDGGRSYLFLLPAPIPA